MYKCRECKEYFDEPRQYTDCVEAWGHMEHMYSYTCPCCGGEDFDEDWIVEEEEQAELEEEEEDASI